MELFISLLSIALLWFFWKAGKHTRPSRSTRARGRRRSGSLSGVRADVEAALRNQGFSRVRARRAAGRASGKNFQELFKGALRIQ